MANRISITPREELLKVPKKWRRKFAEQAAEILIREGRSGEVLQQISELTTDYLSGEAIETIEWIPL